MISSVFVGTIGFAGVASAQDASEPSFDESVLDGTNVNNPSSLQFGPDGKLYVAERFGTIHVLDVDRNGANDYDVTNEETISSVKNLPNHDDDGSYDSGEDQREVTGLVVGGTADNPVLYVSSSDPRIGGGGSGEETGLDTNSGVISKLTPADGGWDHEMLVRGLPRSEENHATNGLELSADGNTLYIAQGGHTNKGAPSNNFAYTPEYALSGAILELDLSQVESMGTKDAANTDVPYRYDLPTIGDSPNQPFGGQDGANMAKLVENGPVGIFSPGYRNPYDVTLTEDGQLYTFDNGPNGGWGGPPADESADQCTNEPNEGDSYSTGDQLHLVTDGFYAGHANPTRGNPDGAKLYDENGEKTGNVDGAVYDGYDGSNECNYKDPDEDGSLETISSSTNGIDEYTASNFDGAMQGDLLTAAFDGGIHRVELNDAGDDATSESKQLSSGLATPLDVTAQGDDDSFPGTVWVADFDGDDINVFEPTDYGGSDDGATCDLSSSDDADNDGYTNEDEQAAGTDPCSSGSVPHDYDDDNVSDVTDNDDDNDGLSDTVDPFAVDDQNGLSTDLPVEYNFSRDSVPGSLEGIGFTGLMTNGQDYQDLYVPDDAVFGGASPILTQEVIKEGDAYQGTNTQQHAYQFGVNPPSEPFVVSAPVTGYPENPENYQSAGIQIGTGDQENYLKLVVQANDGTGGIEMVKEVDGSATTVGQPDDPSVTGESTITDLDLTVYPSNNTVVGSYTVDDGETKTVGKTAIPDGWLDNGVEGQDVGLATGVISTSFGPASEFSATWQDFSVTKLDAGDGGNDGGATSADVSVNENGDIDDSTYTSGTMTIKNTGDTAIGSASIDLSESTLPDTVFDPEGSAGDSVGKDFTVDSGVGGGTTGSFAQPHNGQNGDDGYDVLNIDFADGEFEPGETLKFSTDIDPTSIKGAGGSGGAGSISGLELSGSAVTVESADATVENDLFTDGSPGGSQANAIADPAEAPGLNVDGVTLEDTDFPAHSAATVDSQEQTLTVSGPSGGTVDVLHVVADPVSEDAYDADAYEANKATEVETQTVDLGTNGEATVDVTLSEDSLDYFTAAVKNGDANGRTSDTVILDLGEGTANQPPTADAGANQTVEEGTQVTLDGSGSSDPDGDQLGYSWTQTGGPDVQLSAQDAPSPTFTAPDVDEETTLTFKLEVNDGNGGTDTDTVNVTVTPVDAAAPTISDFNVSADGQDVDVSFQSDEQLADIGVSLGDDASGTLTESDFSEAESGGIYTYTADVSEGADGTFSATLETAADAAGNDGAVGQSDSVTVDTTAENQPPTADAGADQTVDEDVQVTLDATGSSDPDGDTLNYAWTQTDGPSVDLSNADTATPSFTAPDVEEETTLTFELEVADGNGGTDTDTVTVTVTPVDAAAPTITNFGLTNPSDQTLEVSFDSDEELADISVEIADDSGTTVTTLGTDAFSSSEGTYTATYEADGPGTYTATLVTAADAAGNDGASGQSDSATIGAPNSAPTAAFDASPDEPTAGEEVSFDAGGSSDTDGSIASYEWTFGDGTTGSGETTSHTYDAAGEYTVALTVTDDEGATDTTTQTVTVAEEGAPELAASPGSLDFGSVTVGQSETKTVTVTNDGTAALSVSTTDITGTDAPAYTVVDGGADFTLDSGESHDVTVKFAPGSAGDKTDASLEFDTENDGSASTQLLGQSKKANQQPGEITAPAQQDFGTVTAGETSNTRDITVSNIGNGPVTVDTTEIVGSDAPGYSIVDGGADFTLDSGESQEITVKFAPGSAGDKTDASLEIGTENDGAESVNLLGQSEKAGPQKHTLTIDGTDGRTFYAFDVPGELSGTDSLTREDSVRGQSVQGAVGAGADQVTFTGSPDDLTLYVGDGADVSIDGEEVNPNDYESAVSFVGNGESVTSYNFDVKNGKITGMNGLTSEDSVDNGRNDAMGAVRSGSDTYRFRGTFAGLDIDGDGTVILNGQSVDPALFYNTLRVVGQGTSASYDFTVSGEIKDTRGLTSEDTANGNTAIGAIRGGSDTYVYSGTIAGLDTDGDVDLVRNGEDVDASTFYNKIRFRGDGSYGFSVSGEVQDGDRLTVEDSIDGNSAAGAVANGGTDSYYTYSGLLTDLDVDTGVTAVDGDGNEISG